ncbi:MAG: penicillin-binding protein [Terriglobales bacterium]
MAGKTNGNGSGQRLHILAGLLFLWVVAIALRLVYLQVFQYGDLLQRAQRQQQRTIEVAPRRGIIYDRNGRELAMSATVDSIFAVPSEIPDQASAATLLAGVLNSDPQEITTKLKSSRAFAWIARKVDADTSSRIRALNLRGIYFQKESKRFYPKRELAAQALGYVGVDDEGLGGLEHSFDSKLRGAPGKMLISMDARRRWFGRVEREPDPGENLVLTLDEKIQYIAERELEAAMKRTGSASGTIVVQDPRTGEILALANRPTFNPNTFRSAPREALKNRAVSDIYEPGSTFKIVTIAGALEEKLTRPEEMIDCQMGAIFLNGVRIRDHKAFRMLSVSDILAHSSDVGAIKLGLRLGEARFDRYIRAFGFGSETGVELPGETRGLAKPVNRWSKVSIGAISMGQEIGITPLQLVSMVSAIANDGLWTPPRIVAGTALPQSTPQKLMFRPAEQRRVISPLTAVALKKMMEGVVLHGTGRRAILNGYTAAGKTGTAQKIDPATRAYSRWKHVASFVGFAPVREPAISVAVILDSPLGAHEGGQVAAPVFRSVAQQVLAYLHVPQDVDPQNARQWLALRAASEKRDDEVAEGSPDRLSWGVEVGDMPAPGAETSSAQAQSARAAEADQAVLEASVATASDEHAGGPLPHAPGQRPGATPAEARASRPLPHPSTGSAQGTVVLDAEGGIVVPSFLGRRLREVVEAAQQAGVEIDAIGTGIAREQAPPAGARIPAGTRVAVRFSR